MSTRRITAFALAAAFLSLPSAALAWNAGTHAYVASHLLHRPARHGAEPQLQRDRLYGSNGPDLFNYAFGEPYFTIADYLHEYATPNATLRVWNAARRSHDPELIAYAQGFVSHDNAFGVDYTAHLDALTRPGKEGYVIAKAAVLAVELDALLKQSGMSLSDTQVQTGAHVLVEAAVDLLVQAKLDPLLGVKLLDATQNADPGIDLLLATAYKDPLAQYFGGKTQAAAAIVSMELAFREINVQYAQALAASSPESFADMAGFNTTLAHQLFQLPLPPPGYPDPVLQLVTWGIARGMELTRDDFQWEILATIVWVNWNLGARDVLP